MKVKELPHRPGMFLTERCYLHYTKRFGGDWPSPKELEENLPDLPAEIWEIILEILFYDYVRAGVIDRALELLTLFSNSFTRRIYHSFFGVGYSSHADKIRERISNILYLSMGLQQDILAVENTLDLVYFTFKFDFKDDFQYLPWELVAAEEGPFRTELSEIAGPLDPEGDPYFEGFCCGPTLGDVLWLQGNYTEHCIYEATRILNPIINLQIATNNIFDWRNASIRKNPAWRGFNKFLRMIFGPNVGIFYAITREFHPNWIYTGTPHITLTEADHV